MILEYGDRDEYAVSTWTMEAFSLADALKKIAELDFPAVELWGDTVHFDPRALGDVHAVKTLLKDLHLRPHSVHGPFRNYPPCEDEASFRHLRLEQLKKTIDACSELECPILVVHALDRGEYNYKPQQKAIVADYLDKLCEYGLGSGVSIALENIPGTVKAEGLDYGDELSCNIADHVANFAGIPLKYCLDIGHALINGRSVESEVQAAAGNLVSIHVHNNQGQFDTHNLPNDGVLDWPGIRRLLRDNAYAGRFVLEVCGGASAFETMEELSWLFDFPREPILE